MAHNITKQSSGGDKIVTADRAENDSGKEVKEVHENIEDQVHKGVREPKEDKEMKGATEHKDSKKEKEAKDEVPPTKHPNTTCKGSSSENSIKKDKGAKEKNVVSVKSWNCREMHSEAAELPSDVEKDLAQGVERIAITETQDDFVANPNLLRARDSLEDLLKNEEVQMASPRPKPNTSRSAREKILPETNRSSPTLGETKKPSSVAKVLAWDPFDKVGRKCKDNKRKKMSKKLEGPKIPKGLIQPVIKIPNVEKKTGDEISDSPAKANDEEEIDNFENVYDFKFQPKNTKSVVFTNEVMVVYFNGETVISEAKEPLKRELEQQVRNKEMRRGHILKAQEDYKMCLF